MCGCAPCGGAGGTGRPPVTKPPPPPKPKLSTLTGGDPANALPFFTRYEGWHIFLVTLSKPHHPHAPPDKTVEAAHVKHLEDIWEKGRLLVCGLTALGEGYLVLVTETKREAEQIAKTDPLIHSGYYKHFDVVELFGPAPSDRHG